MDDIITSRANPLICEIAKLSDKKYRDEEKLFIFEGKKLLEEAITSDLEIKYIFYTEDNCDFFDNKLLNICKKIVSDGVYAKITEEKAPQGILCVAKYLDNFHKNVKIYSNNYSKIFMLSSIRDPGNLGTIIRTACAFGIDKLILSDDCADIYNSKTIRASMGALFRQKIVICEDIIDTIKILKSKYKIYAAVLENAEDIRNIKLTDNTCFILGNEGHGLSDEMVNICDHKITIPMVDGTESLNVSAAAAVLMWEVYKEC